MCSHQQKTGRGAYTAEILENRKLCDEHYFLRLGLDSFPPTGPGQFIQLHCRRLGRQVSVHEVDWPADRPPKLTQPELTDREPMLRRPISIAGRRDTETGVELEFIYRTVGTSTYWLADSQLGWEISLLGPNGGTFPVFEDKPVAVLVGGGVGIPPMIYLAEMLADAGKRVVAFSGAQRGSLMPLTVPEGRNVPADPVPGDYVKEFAGRGAEAVLATDDGSLGYQGFVTQALAEWLDAENLDAADVAAYSCGPEPMMQVLTKLCIERDILCRLSLERYMACGMGTCQSCVVKIRDDSESGWSFRLCCTDGPVFDARDIIW
ncbi:MAG: hypothetical protein ACLFVU_02280 [Phycisphaerae bacterium]